jgi:hypothetical protein
MDMSKDENVYASKELVEALENKFGALLSRPIILSKIDEPLLVRFMASDVPIKIKLDEPTALGFPVQIYDHHGKQLSTCSRIRVEWAYLDETNGNIALIERFMLMSDFKDRKEIGTQLNEATRKVLKTCITTKEDFAS